MEIKGLRWRFNNHSAAENLLQISPTIINLLFCFVVLSVLYSRIPTYGDQIDWDLDFRILLISNIILILLEPLPFLRKSIWIIIAIRGIAIAIMAIPYPQTLFLDAFLVTGLFLSMLSRIKLEHTFPAGLGILAFYFIVKTLPSHFQYSIDFGLAEIVFFVGFFTSLNLLYYLARFGISNHHENEKVVAVLKESIKQLTTESSHFLKYAATAEESSSNEERKRITRELHDIIGKTFTDIIMMMQANVRNTPEDEEELKEIFRWVGDQSRLGLGEIRKVLYDLRSSIKVDPITLKSLVVLAKSFGSSANMQVHLMWGNSKISYGSVIDRAIYRIVQEALVNALRHGHATEVQIHFWETASELKVTIQDNGSGFSKDDSKGIGQSGMEERLQDLGGSIAFKRTLDGYQVQVIIPITGNENIDLRGEI